MSIHEGVRIYWSREGGVLLEGEYYGAFTRASYIARVEYEDGNAVVVVLPPGAVARPASEYAEDVHRIADETLAAGNNTVVCG